MEKPKFSLQDIKYATDDAIFGRANQLFESGKVKNIKENPRDYSATVQGTSPYKVSLSKKDILMSDCTCYMGKNDLLCKHVLALALAVLKLSGGSLQEESLKNLKEVKLFVAKGLKKIKSYNGPSRIWFAYQRDLDVGTGIILEAVQNLSATQENAKYLWNLVLKLSNKLARGGIDDSDGIVGNCIMSLASQCAQYVQKEPKLKALIKSFSKDETGFDFEEYLIEMLEK